MPSINMKVAGLTIITAQGIRMECESCGEPFTVLAHREDTASGFCLPTGDEEALQLQVLRQGLKKIGALSGKPRRGRGRCPHCAHVQGWMQRRRFWTAFGYGALLYFTFAFVGGGMVASLLAEEGRFGEGDAQILPVILTVLLCGIPGAVLGAWTGLRGEPSKDADDPRTLTDAALLALIEDCKARDIEPMLAWAAACGKKLFKEEDTGMNVSLGVLDTLGTLPLPDDQKAEVF